MKVSIQRWQIRIPFTNGGRCSKSLGTTVLREKHSTSVSKVMDFFLFVFWFIILQNISDDLYNFLTISKTLAISQ